MKLIFMALFAISTVRILSCGTVAQNGRRIHQFVERHGKKTVDESLRLKRLGMDKLKTEIDETEEQETDENVQVHSDYEDISDDYLFFDKFLEDKEEEKEDREVIILDSEDETKECNGPEFDDFYGEFCPLYVHRGKRDATNDFLAGILSSGEKFIDGNIGGSVTTFLKTLIQPMFHYFIHSNNDPVMEKFTSRFIPETTLQGSANGLRMIGAAEEGDGAMVWETMHQNTEAWNPRSSWSHLRDRTQAEQRAFKKFIPTILAVDKTISKRLKDISLVITTLSTSLHDTMIEGMNKGFKSASGSFKDLNEDHNDLIKLLGTIFDVLEDDITANMKIVAISIVLAFIALQSGLGFWQNRSLQLQNGSLETMIREMKQGLEESAVREARLEQKLDDLIQERNSIASSITRVVEQAVKDAISVTRYQPVKRVQMNDNQMRRESYTNQIQPALGFSGNHVSNPNAFVLVPQ